jgi:hypothetical protein
VGITVLTRIGVFGLSLSIEWRIWNFAGSEGYQKARVANWFSHPGFFAIFTEKFFAIFTEKIG